MSWELDEERREVTVAELDDAVKAVKNARQEYDMAKAISTDKYKVLEDLENKLIELLDLAGKNSYETEGVARATMALKTSVTVPKDLEDKKKLFDWIETKYGEEGLLSYLTINYATLNSFYNQELKEANELGREFNIEGLGVPTVTKTLQFRAK